MFSLNIQNEHVYFKDIKPDNLPDILKWYNKVEDFKFATGIDSPITLDELTRKYAEVAICSNEFFIGIHMISADNMIGILKGRLEYDNKDSVWISSIVIDSSFQGKGYGSYSIELLLKHLKENTKIRNAYLAVIEDNLHGRVFWNKLDFWEIRRIEKHIKLEDKQQNVIILYRKL